MYARQLDLPIQTHLAETAHEVGAEPRTARRDAARAAAPARRDRSRLHRASTRVHLAADDIDLLATHGGHVVHCPASNMKLGSGIAPVTALLARGINVALGTDGAASNNRLDLFGEMRLAALLAKVATGDPAVLPAQQALRCGDARRRAGAGPRRARSARSSPGKQADIVAVDLSARSTRRPATIRFRISSTRSGAMR